MVGRALAILEGFGPDEPELSLAELTTRTGIPKPTVHRIAGNLLQQGLLERSGAGFRLGMGLFELGQRVTCHRDVRDVAVPLMHELFEDTHATVRLAVLDRAEVLWLAKVVGHNGVALSCRAGGRMPAHTTASGKVLLAFGCTDEVRELLAGGLVPLTPYTITDPGELLRQLATIRRDGVAFEHEECAIGKGCVAAPIFRGREGAVASISVGGPAIPLQARRRAPAVCRTAARISRRLGGMAPMPTP